MHELQRSSHAEVLNDSWVHEMQWLLHITMHLSEAVQTSGGQISIEISMSNLKSLAQNDLNPLNLKSHL